MSKVQTFEEWMTDAYGSPCTGNEPVTVALRQAWQAAMENAARVCEDFEEMYYRQYPGTGGDEAGAASASIAAELRRIAKG